MTESAIHHIMEIFLISITIGCMSNAHTSNPFQKPDPVFAVDMFAHDTKKVVMAHRMQMMPEMGK